MIQDSLNQLNMLFTAAYQAKIDGKPKKLNYKKYAIDPTISAYLKPEKCTPEVKKAILSNPQIMDFLRDMGDELNALLRRWMLDEIVIISEEYVKEIRARFPHNKSFKDL